MLSISLLRVKTLFPASTLPVFQPSTLNRYNVYYIRLFVELFFHTR